MGMINLTMNIYLMHNVMCSSRFYLTSSDVQRAKFKNDSIFPQCILDTLTQHKLHWMILYKPHCFVIVFLKNPQEHRWAFYLNQCKQSL